MTAKELAVKLNDSQYDHIESLISSISKLAKNNGLVIVYGASDDLMKFRGAIYNEINCYYYTKMVRMAVNIEAIRDQNGYSWIYKTNIPHETFNILEGDKKFCRGIVFSIDDLENM